VNIFGEIISTVVSCPVITTFHFPSGLNIGWQNFQFKWRVHLKNLLNLVILDSTNDNWQGLYTIYDGLTLRSNPQLFKLYILQDLMHVWCLLFRNIMYNSSREKEAVFQACLICNLYCRRMKRVFGFWIECYVYWVLCPDFSGFQQICWRKYQPWEVRPLALYCDGNYWMLTCRRYITYRHLTTDIFLWSTFSMNYWCLLWTKVYLE